jgi:hypothetical protein
MFDAPTQRPAALASGSSALAGDIAATIARAEGSSQNAVTHSDDVIAAPRAKRRALPLVLIGGAAAAVAITIVMVVVLRGGNDDRAKPARVSANDPATSSDVQVPETVDSRATQGETGNGSQMRIDEAKARKSAAAPTPATGSAAPTEPPPPVTEVPPPTEVVATVPPPAPPPVKRPATLGGKKVVLEYDNTAPKEKAPVAKKGDDSASVGAARITYFNGNKKLFSGDADGAIKLYKQALAVYPGYVAGYRGLGLAYAQKGDKQNALKAFRTYIAAVPGAKDVALVKKRIAALQR